jgi:plastocyanin
MVIVASAAVAAVAAVAALSVRALDRVARGCRAACASNAVDGRAVLRTVGAPVAVAGSGAIRGTVRFAGDPPPLRLHDRRADSYCAQTSSSDESVLVWAGMLRNVLVHVEGAAASRGPDAPARMIQDGCVYRPHVLGLVAGQALELTNADRTLHNVHVYAGRHTLFNQAEVAGAPQIAELLPTGIFQLRCDVHPWMKAWVGVFENRWFAVSDGDGRFAIEGVPPGRYTLEAWHERLGVKRTPIEVRAGASSEVSFEYRPEDHGP